LKEYRRYEANVSDHRPISASFDITVKVVDRNERDRRRREVEQIWVSTEEGLLKFARDFYGEPRMAAQGLLTGPAAPSANTKLSIWGSHRNAMRMDVLEKDDHYAVHVDLPGVPKEDVKINMEGNVLTIGAERTERKQEEHENYHLKERRYGKMSRSIVLPKDVDMEHTQAKFDNGELCITIPRVQKKDETRSIEIQ